MTREHRLRKIAAGQHDCTETAVLNAIRARGTRNFTGPELARELALCRQTVYRYIRKLRESGHVIEGEPWFGFMACLKGEDA